MLTSSPSKAEKETPTLSPDHERPPAASEAGPRLAAADLNAADAVKLILTSLEDDKAEDILSIDVKGKSSVADVIIVASGRSARHVGALADHVLRKLKEAGAQHVRAEGMPACDWVLVDAGDVIVHLFRPEVRSFYNIERIWSAPAALAS